MTLKKWIDTVGQAEAARTLGITRQRIHYWYHGKARPSFKAMHLIIEKSDNKVTARDLLSDFLK